MGVSAVLGWSLAVAAIAIGWMRYGWPGVLLALGVVVFWLLLQFSRALRVMRLAGQSPVGRVDSAVMLAARLKPGQTMLQVIALTRSLGRRVSAGGEEPERWTWTDESGARVNLALRRGRLDHWTLQGPDTTPAAPAAGGVMAGSDPAGKKAGAVRPGADDGPASPWP